MKPSEFGLKFDTWLEVMDPTLWGSNLSCSNQDSDPNTCLNPIG